MIINPEVKSREYRLRRHMLLEEAIDAYEGQDAVRLRRAEGWAHRSNRDRHVRLPRVTTVRSMKLGSQAEGCVIANRTGLLYVAEEDVGLWRFGANTTAPTTATPIARVDW
jgi:hypothetical protein